MKNRTIPLADHAACTVAACGGKAAALARLEKEGLRVPAGFAITVGAYHDFTGSAGLREKIILELSRKDFSAMRWEELWDASLRIRNLFLKTPMPAALGAEIIAAVDRHCRGRPLAIRSSSPVEDGQARSFAGVHESYIGISGRADILKHVRLVWASLWSDAALAYQAELSLDAGKSAMAVAVQEMITGEKSGVAFSVNPLDPGQAVIESVRGLNQGLVDGEIEPDRWLIDRQTGRVARRELAGGGTRGALNAAEVTAVYRTARHLETVMGSPQDMEWTFRGRDLYLLQSRPITTAKPKSGEFDRRDFDLGLRRSFSALKSLGARIEKELLPAMSAAAAAMEGIAPGTIPDARLEEEIEKRRACLAHWEKIYWSEFIPFAHAARLFGEVFNDRLTPDDPHLFLELLAGESSLGLERNRKLAAAAGRLKEIPGARRPAEVNRLAEELGLPAPAAGGAGETGALLEEFLERLARAGRPEKAPEAKRRARLEARFFASFSDNEQELAREILALARKSYRLRDDDNLYLGALKQGLERALAEKARRSGAGIRPGAGAVPATEEDAPAPPPARARQMRGQSASGGIARGRARVIRSRADLLTVSEGEIIVCDAIDPGMTFIIPLAAGIVERRGGMLVHGAIIAREYGLPCVTGIPRATEVIKNGDELTVDGYFGLVINHAT